MRIAGIVGLLLLAAGALAFTSAALREGAPREVVVIARDMAFVVEAPSAGDPAPAAGPPPGAGAKSGRPDPPGASDAPNPTIVLRAGERVRLVLRNLDPGMRHDLVVEALGLRTAALDHGESEAIVFRAPGEKGEWDYHCTFHARLMRGRVAVR